MSYTSTHGLGWKLNPTPSVRESSAQSTQLYAITKHDYPSQILSQHQKWKNGVWVTCYLLACNYVSAMCQIIL